MAAVKAQFVLGKKKTQGIVSSVVHILNVVVSTSERCIFC